MSSILTEKEFLSQLYIIQSNNPPSQVLFPHIKTIYDVDLQAREINAPEFLSVSKDHSSETIYFRMDRYYDYMDLSLLTCIIQYITPDEKMHWYAVPFRDVTTEKDNDKMIIPWSIDGNVTQYAGIVAFSIRFYSVEQEIIARSDEIDDEAAKDIEPEIKYNLLYNLTTLPAYSKILEGMEVKEAANDFNISGEAAAYLLQLIQQINREEGVDWILADPS